jgi:CheY-like chemotaxis protein
LVITAQRSKRSWNAGKYARWSVIGRRVFVVDDDILVLELLAYMLADLGCDTLTARSGSKALGTIAQDQTIEILFSDINMPGLDGSNLAARTQNHPAYWWPGR